MYDYLFLAILILEFLLAMFVSGNNLSAAVGTLVGARVVTRAGGVIIGAAGFIAGFLIQGGEMSSAAVRLLQPNEFEILILFSVVILIFTVAQILKSPLSLAMALVGTAVGISIRSGTILDTGYLEIVVLIWIVTPVAAIVLSLYANRFFGKIRTDRTWNMASTLKILLLGGSAFTAYTLGANTIGLIAAFAGSGLISKIAVVAGILVGSVFLSKGVLKRIGQEMYTMRYFSALTSLLVSSFMVEGATLFSLPLSSTQTLTSAVFGAGLSYKFKTLFTKPYLIVIATWIISPVLGLSLGYAL